MFARCQIFFDGADSHISLSVAALVASLIVICLEQREVFNSRFGCNAALVASLIVHSSWNSLQLLEVFSSRFSISPFRVLRDINLALPRVDATFDALCCVMSLALPSRVDLIRVA